MKIKNIFLIIILFIPALVYSNQGEQKFCTKDFNPVCVVHKEHNCEDCFVKKTSFSNRCIADYSINNETYTHIMPNDVIDINEGSCRTMKYIQKIQN